jgi:hypothetical protein
MNVFDQPLSMFKLSNLSSCLLGPFKTSKAFVTPVSVRATKTCPSTFDITSTLISEGSPIFNSIPLTVAFSPLNHGEEGAVHSGNSHGRSTDLGMALEKRKIVR